MGTSATIQSIWGAKWLNNGTGVIFSDINAKRIGFMSYPEGAVSMLAGTGSAFAISGKPQPVDISSDDSFVIFADGDTGGNKIYLYNLTGTPSLNVLAGNGNSQSIDGTGVQASFKRPSGVSIMGSNSFAIIADREGCVIRKLIISTAVVTTVAGNGTCKWRDGVGTFATFSAPMNMEKAKNDSFVLILDIGARSVRRMVMSTYEVILCVSIL